MSFSYSFLVNRVDPNQDEVIQRYKQSVAPSERIYQSVETIDEALKTPWALHYEIDRRPATPNLPSHSTDREFKQDMKKKDGSFLIFIA